MSTTASVRLYFQEILKLMGSGMKALILDKETVSIISLVFPQSELAQNEIYIFEKLESMSRDSLKFVNAIVLIRPVESNINFLCNELKVPRYGHYYIFFTNSLNPSYLEILAKSDPTNSVKEVQEIYCDFYAIESHLFTTNQKNFIEKTGWINEAKIRCAESLAALSLSLKLKFHIRYQKSSTICKDLAESTKSILDSSYSEMNYFKESGQKTKSCLLIIDRRFDPITPLLFPVTYQAMIHEIFTITNNLLKISNLPQIDSELKETILSPELDGIFEANMFLNFEKVKSNFKSLLAEYKSYESHAKDKLPQGSVDDLKAVVNSLPDMAKTKNAVSKHVKLACELQRIIDARKLLDQYEYEIRLIKNEKTNESFIQTLIQLIINSNISQNDAIRLSILFFICHYSSISKYKDKIIKCLQTKGISENIIKAVEFSLSYSYDIPSIVKFSNYEFALSQQVKNNLRQLLNPEYDNVAHTPALQQVINGFLKHGNFVSNFVTVDGKNENFSDYSDIVIFIVGGITYEESLLVHDMNKSKNGCHIILGGTMIHNSASFIEQLQSFMP